MAQVISPLGNTDVGFLISSSLSDKVLCCPGRPHSHYRAEDDLDVLHPPALTAQVLGSQECATRSG